MKCWNNGKCSEYPDPTPEEVAELNRQEYLEQLRERSRPLTEGEVFSMLLSQKVQEIKVDDNAALRMRQFYPTFESIVGQTIEKQGFKFTYADKLWATVQPNLLIQGHYPPGIGMESLYAEICETHDGTMDDPIPYSGNMALEQGKYYIQDGEIYICTRDTVNPVYHALSELVGLYVSIA